MQPITNWIFIILVSLVAHDGIAQQQESDDGKAVTSEELVSESKEEALAESVEGSDSGKAVGGELGAHKKEPRIAKQAARSNEISLEWYRPTSVPLDNLKRNIITLKGRVNKQALVYITKPKIPIIVRNKIKYYPTRRAFTKNNKRYKKRYGTLSDEYGYFELQLELPRYAVQLPIKVIAKDRSQQNIVLKLFVQKDESNIIDSDLITPRLRKDKKFGVWLGIGGNYLDYSQETEAPEAQKYSYSSLKFPALYGKFEYHLNRQWDISLEYKDAPGEAKESDTISVSNSEYSWTIVDLGAFYTPRSWEQNKFLFGKYADYGLRFGIQHHSVPFLFSTGGAEVNIENVTMDFVTLGGFFKVYDRSNWVYELYLRYQHPVATSDELAITPTFAFDGSVGAFYLLSNNFRIGTFWYGSYQAYEFDKVDMITQSGPGVFNGSQSLLFSNLEVRLGFEW